MHMEPTAILSSVSALAGALIGGGASVVTTVYTQRFQDRLQRIALSKSLDPDPLLAFSSLCRADLDNIQRTTV
jgi:hypothetical protein